VGSLTGPQVAAMLLAAGATPEQATYFDAVAHRESGLDPNAHGGPPAEPLDDSYGLFQINMLGAMGPQRRQLFGIQNDAQLYDPATSVAALKKLSSNFTNKQPWTVPGGTPYTGLNMTQAAADVKAAQEGGGAGAPAVGQTPTQGPGSASGSGSSWEIPIGDVAGQHLGIGLPKDTIVKVALVVFGGLIVLVGLYVAFDQTAPVQDAKSAAVDSAKAAAVE